MLLVAGCHLKPGPEECNDKTIVSVVEVPEEVCDLNPPRKVQKPLLTKWCLEPAPGQSYEEKNAKGEPIDPSGLASSNRDTSVSANRKNQRMAQNKPKAAVVFHFVKP